jgi:hypothetical protein
MRGREDAFGNKFLKLRLVELSPSSEMLRSEECMVGARLPSSLSASESGKAASAGLVQVKGVIRIRGHIQEG